VLLAHARAGVEAPRNVLVAPNVVIEDAVHRFSRLVGLDDTDRRALERRLAEQTGTPIEALAVEQLAAPRDGALLVIHDRDDREVPFVHGERLAAAWPHARLLETHGLGHRRILRDPAVLAAAVDIVREGVAAPRSDLVREVDRWLEGDAVSGTTRSDRDR
jgi:pimeloyl-ACP methyl ester carboxylesterase